MSVEKGIRYELMASLCPNNTGEYLLVVQEILPARGWIAAVYCANCIILTHHMSGVGRLQQQYLWVMSLMRNIY